MMTIARGWRLICILVQTVVLLQREEQQILGFSVYTSSSANRPRRQREIVPSLLLPSSSLTFSSASASSSLSLSSSASKSSTAEPPTLDDAIESNLPLKGKNGIYEIETEEQHKAFLEANKDKIVVMKIFAPWCRACKGLAPKYQMIANDKKYENLPLAFTELSIQHNKDYVKSIGVLALPSVQFYLRGQLAETFPCGPSKTPILKRKLAKIVNENVNAKTLQLKEAVAVATTQDQIVTPPTTDKGVAAAKDEDDKSTDLQSTEKEESPTVSAFRSMVGAAPKRESPDQTLSKEELIHLRTIPFFSKFNQAEFDSVEKKGRVLSFQEGSVIMKEGNMGSTFYVILEGEVEILQRTGFNDPLTTPSTYLGTVINRLGKGDFFGERALMTGEPRAASIRVTESTRCLAWNGVDLPSTCILNRRAYENQKLAGYEDAVPEVDIAPYNEKYGVEVTNLNLVSVDEQIKQSNKANQVRGSVFTPFAIPGVDNDEDYVFDDDKKTEEETSPKIEVNMEGDSVISLLQRLKLVRLVSKGFDYMMKTDAKWGDSATRRRRSILVHRLTNTQREEIRDAFKLVDESRDGSINVLELKRALVCIGDCKTDTELRSMIAKASSLGNVDEEQEITFEDFMGIMAEAEFYYLFRDIFASLDSRDIGFVRAKDLDRVLCGVRDLISDDRNSIIDVEDKDTLIDYEQFTKMLLGTAL